MAEHESVLVVDLLGGIGDLVMALPAIHALARRPGARVRVLTHGPGDTLLWTDPAVAEVRRVDPGEERAAVVEELDRRPDLVVSTTRLHGIPDLVAERGLTGVTNLWRNPPADEPVGRRYVRILAAEGLVEDRYRPPRLHLTPAECAAAEADLPDRAPVVLVPGAGMAVKRWPHWTALVRALGDVPVVAVDDGSPAVPGLPTLPPTDLRGLAARFAAVARLGGVVVGGDTGPVRVAAAAGARTVGLFGPTAAGRYGLDDPGANLQGLSGCPHRRPTAITEQVCWWEARCPLAALPACMVDLAPDTVAEAVRAALLSPAGPRPR